jgi:hypothetical protein
MRQRDEMKSTDFGDSKGERPKAKAYIVQPRLHISHHPPMSQGCGTWQNPRNLDEAKTREGREGPESIPAHGTELNI